MPGTYVSRAAARAVISAALAAGSLSLAAAAPGACTTPGCVSGVSPAAAAALECTDPTCVSGTPPAPAPWPGSRVTGRAGHGRPLARAAGGISTAAGAASAHASTGTATINCPPPNPKMTDPISDC